MEIENIITDYERGVISAIESDYPNLKHYGCFFQYSKSIYQKIEDLGLSGAYRENPLVKKISEKLWLCHLFPKIK